MSYVGFVRAVRMTLNVSEALEHGLAELIVMYALGSAPPINGSKRGFVYITQPKMSTRKSNLLEWVVADM